MLEGKALIVAVMMLTAAPIAATDEGQAFLGDITYDLGEILDTDEEENKVIDRKLDDTGIEDNELLLTDENLDVDCLTLGQWKEQFLPEDKVVVREEKDGARNGDSKETDEKENDLDKKDWVDKDTVTKDDCLSAEEWTLKFESDRVEPCFTLEDLEKKVRDDRKDWHGNWEDDWDKERDNDNDDESEDETDEEESEQDEDDDTPCNSPNCDNDDESEDETDEEESEQDEDDDTPCNSPNCDNDDESEDEEEASGDDEVTIIHDDDVSDDHDHENDRDEENWEEIRAVIEELAVACEDGNEEACVELREMITEIMSDRKEDWNKDWHKDG
ncbi:MAG TPA: hypothetical protein EYQ70_01785, partial [Marine Group III euryarchaeote]|nr:hypothetical protein [Marine Group III euryarchaeote]